MNITQREILIYKALDLLNQGKTIKQAAEELNVETVMHGSDNSKERCFIFDKHSYYWEKDPRRNYDLVKSYLTIMRKKWDDLEKGQIITVAEIMKELAVCPDVEDYLFGWVKGISNDFMFQIKSFDTHDICDIVVQLSGYDFLEDCATSNLCEGNCITCCALIDCPDAKVRAKRHDCT